MKIYVLHYSKLVERKKSILEQFDKHGITNFEFIEKYDTDNITTNGMDVFGTNLKFGSHLKLPIISLILKHIHVYYEMCIHNIEQVLIFEDDVILCDNFTEKLTNYLSQMPPTYDMLFIGDGCNLHIDSKLINPTTNIYKKSVNPTRCTDSYIISLSCAKQIIEYIRISDTINLPSDWWLHKVLPELNSNVYWAEPTIVTQGSQNNVFKSSLQL
jgi:GR25 family glycosyltransferase involved in LPS biosynthesis